MAAAAERRGLASRVCPGESKFRKAADKEGREWPYLLVRGSGVRPDSATSAASEIARRKNKSFAQYTGAQGPRRPHMKGLQQKYLVRISPSGGLQGLR